MLRTYPFNVKRTTIPAMIVLSIDKGPMDKTGYDESIKSVVILSIIVWDPH